MLRVLFFPRGILVFVAIPLSLLQPSRTIGMDIFTRIVRFTVSGGDFKLVREWILVMDFIERIRVWWSGCSIETVKRRVGEQIVSGSWIVSKGDILPDYGSPEWNGRLVCLWIHGGGFGAGSAITAASSHCTIMLHYKTLVDTKGDGSVLPMVYFCLEYQLAPEKKYPSQLDSACAAYFWLVNQVGARNIVLGGDSAGGNLSVLLYDELLKQKVENPLLVLPKSIALVSPWLDISLSHTPPDIMNSLSCSDAITMEILEAWRDNITPHGMNPRDPQISPFFNLSPFEMPQDGLLVVYGSTEVFAPVIDVWIKSLRKQEKKNVNQGEKLKVVQFDKVVVGVGMPHDFAMVGASFPVLDEKAQKALIEIATFYSRSCLQ